MTKINFGPLLVVVGVVVIRILACCSLHAMEIPPASYFRSSLTEVITNAVPCEARPLPLSDVRLTGGPLKQAQELDAKYLLELEPDRMLYYLRKRAGLEPKAKEGYGGWDGGGRNLTGHIAGHYLSAVSYMYAATGDSRFQNRADYIVKQLQEIQNAQGA